MDEVMKDDRINEILESINGGKITIEDGLTLLKKEGVDESLASEMLMVARGETDIVGMTPEGEYKPRDLSNA